MRFIHGRRLAARYRLSRGHVKRIVHSPLIWGYTAWGVLAGMAVYAFGEGWLLHFAQLQQPLPAPGDPALALFQLPKSELYASPWLPPWGYAASMIGIESLFFLVFFGASVWLVFWKGDSWTALVGAITFVVCGTVTGITQPLKIPMPHHPIGGSEHAVALFLSMATDICGLLFFCVFPAERLLFRRAWIAIVAWSTINIVWFADLVWPKFPLHHIPLNWLDAEGSLRNPEHLEIVISTFLVFGIGVFMQVRWYFYHATSAHRRQMQWVFLSLALGALGAFLLYAPSVFVVTGSGSSDIFSLLGQVGPFKFNLAIYHIVSTLTIGLLMASVPVSFCIALAGLRLKWVVFLLRAQLYGVLSSLVIGLLLLASASLLLMPEARHKGSWSLSTLLEIVILEMMILILAWFCVAYVVPEVVSVARWEFFEKPQVEAIGRTFYEVSDRARLPRILAARVVRLARSTHCGVYRRETGGRLRAEAVYPGTIELPRELVLSEDQLRSFKNGRCLALPPDAAFGMLTVPLLSGLTADADRGLVGVLVLGSRRPRRRSRLPWRRAPRRYPIGLRWAVRALARHGAQAIALKDTTNDASPDWGRARDFAQELQAQPERALLAVHRLVEEACQTSAAEGVLSLLPQALHMEEAERAPRDLAAAFARMHTSVAMGNATAAELALELGRLTKPLASDEASLWIGNRSARVWYELCRAALRAPASEEIAALLPHLHGFLPAEPANDAASVAIGSTALCGVASIAVHDPDDPWRQCIPTVDGLCTIAKRMHDVLEIEAVEDREVAVIEVQRQLTYFDHQLPPEHAPLERFLARCIGDHWSMLCETYLQQLRDQTDPSVTFLTHQVFASPRVSLLLEIAIGGRRPISQLTVQLLPSADYEVVVGEHTLEELAPHRPPVVCEFVVAPRAGVERLHTEFHLRYQDERRVWERRPQAEVTLKPIKDFRPFGNPYWPAGGLEPNSPLFFGRERLLTMIEEAIDQGRDVVLTGQWRMGKTSILNQLLGRARDRAQTASHPVHPVFFNCHGMTGDGVAAFFHMLAAEISDALNLPAPPPFEAFLVSPDAPGYLFEREVLPRVFAALGADRLLLLIDEFPALGRLIDPTTRAPTVVRYFRHLMEHENQVAFVFAGKCWLEELNPAVWATVFNSAQHHRLDVLDRAAADALIEQPLRREPVAGRLEIEDLARVRMYQVTAGHPYFLQWLCQVVVNAAQQEQRSYVRVAHVNEAIPVVLSRGGQVLDDIWNEDLPSLADRLVLYSLSHLMPFSGQATAADVTAYWRQHKQYDESIDEFLDDLTVDASLQRLCLHDILVRHEPLAPFDKPNYRWKLPLMGPWVQQHRSVSDVLARRRRAQAL